MSENSNLITGFSIAAFSIGVLSLIFSFIPCIGMYSAAPAFIGLVLAVIAFAKAKQINQKKGFSLAAIIICVVALAIAGWQYTNWQAASEKIDDISTRILNASDSLSKANQDDFLDDEIDMALDSFDSNSDEIRTALDSMKTNE